MPKLKQPKSLEDISMGRLVRFCSQLCVEVSGTGDLDRLHRMVLFIKGYAAPHIPPQLHAVFYNWILRILWSDNSELLRHPLSHQEIVLEMIMDVKISGLECDFSHLPLRLSEADRIRGLTRLTIRTQEILRSPAKFHLDDLRYLDIESRLRDTTCTDEDLRMIAQKCPMLEHLTIRSSEHVTDAGLRALAPCSNLRSLSIDDNSSVSLSAIDQFLSATERKREMPVYWYRPSFDNSDTSVYRFIESLTLDNYRIPHEHLHSVVAKFPNLRHFRISDGTSRGDISYLHVLSGLEKLSSLELYCDNCNVRWTDLVFLFRRIGANLRKLAIPFLDRSDIDQDRFNLLYELCPNVEYLEVSTRCAGSTLVVPQFKNLAYVKCHNYSHRREDGVLEFAVEYGAVLKLEELVVLGFDMGRKMLEMMLDHRTFPNLKKITIEETEKPAGKINRLRRIAEKNNLDLELRDEYWESM